MGELGLGLGTVGRNEESLTVHEAELAMLKRWEKQGVFYPVKSLLRVKNNIALQLHRLGRYDQALVMRRELYASCMADLGTTHAQTINAALNLGAYHAPPLRRVERPGHPLHLQDDPQECLCRHLPGHLTHGMERSGDGRARETR